MSIGASGDRGSGRSSKSISELNARKRKTEPSQYNLGFRPSIQSQGYRPVTTFDNSKKIKQQTSELVRNEQVKQKQFQRDANLGAQDLARRQAQQTTNLNLKQGEEKRELARKKELFGAVADLSKTFMQGYKEWNDLKVQQQEDEELMDFLFGGDTESAVQQAEQGDNQFQVDAAATQNAIGNETDDPAIQQAVGEPVAEASSFQVGRATTSTEAATLYPAYLTQFMQSDHPIVLPDGSTIPANQAYQPHEIAAAVQTGRRLILGGMGVRDFRISDLRLLQGTVTNTEASVIANRTAEGGKLRQQDRDRVVQTRANQILGGMTDETNIGVNAQQIVQLIQSNTPGMTNTQANDAGVKFIIEWAVANGRPDVLRQLMNEPKFIRPDGTPGDTWGSTYNIAINTGIKQATQTRDSNNLAQDREDKEAATDVQSTYIQAVIACAGGQECIREAGLARNNELTSLAGRGNTFAADALMRLPENGNINFDPTAATRLANGIADGSTTREDIEEAGRAGTVTPEQYTDLLSQLPDAQQYALIDTQIEDTEDLMSAQVLNILGQPRVLGDSLGVLNSEQQADLLQPVLDDLELRRIAYLRDQVRNSDRPLTAQEIEQLDREWRRTNLGPDGLLSNVKLQNGQITGYNFVYGAPGSLDYTNPDTGERSIDLSHLPPGVRVSQITNGTPVTSVGEGNDRTSTVQNDFDPSTDRILSDEEIASSLAALDNIQPGDNISDALPGDVVRIADALGITPTRLLTMQGEARGLDITNIIQNRMDIAYTDPENQVTPGRIDVPYTGESVNGSTQSSGPVSVAPAPVNMKQGMTILQGMGFSDSGTTYLLSNIMTESGWIPNREPWDDVGAPAGGLVSWRGPRLTRIEQYLGKPIQEASVQEQLKAMEWEMSTFPEYANANRIFRNPNATASQLERASFEYWGYGVRGERFGSDLQTAQALIGRPAPSAQHISPKLVEASDPQSGSGFTVQGAYDSLQRPVILSAPAMSALEQMVIDSNGQVRYSDITSSTRTTEHNQRVGGVPGSNHLTGEAIDIHGTSNPWIRRYGPRYGWFINDYDGSHGGHFDFRPT